MLIRGRKICCSRLQLQLRFQTFSISAMTGRAGFLDTRERAILVMAKGESSWGFF
jgi:hypothetical protein